VDPGARCSSSGYWFDPPEKRLPLTLESFDLITTCLTNTAMRPPITGRNNLVSGYVFENCGMTRFQRKKARIGFK